MKRIELLKKRQVLLKAEITANLDFIIGTVAKSPSMSGYNITTKKDGKTLTRYVRKALVGRAQDMARRYVKLWRLMLSLSKINWQILNLENE